MTSQTVPTVVSSIIRELNSLCLTKTLYGEFLQDTFGNTRLGPLLVHYRLAGRQAIRSTLHDRPQAETQSYRVVTLPTVRMNNST